MKPINNYDGYFISDDGKVVLSYRKFKKNGNINATHLSDDGYLKTYITDNNGKRLHASIHRLVALAYVPNPENLPEVNHEDGNKLNNHFRNLKWCDRKYNMGHALETGLLKPLKLEKHGMAKLVLNTQTGVFYNTMIEAVNSTSHIKKSFLSMMLLGKRRNSSSFIYA